MTPPRDKPSKTKPHQLGVRIVPGSIVDIVHVDSIAVHTGSVVYLDPEKAAEAARSSHVLELVTEDD